MLEYITNLVLDGTPYYEVERMVKAQILSMDSDGNKFITEVMLEGMLCLRMGSSLCNTVAVMLSFIPIDTKEMCAFYNKASSLFFRDIRTESR